MQAQLLKTAVSKNVQDNQETQSAEYNQKTGGQIQQNIVLIGNQVGQISKDIKAGIIEGGDGMELLIPRALKGG